MRFGVVMISSVFYPSVGGAQTHTLRLSQKLRARGVEVFVVTRHHRGLARYEELDGLPIYRVGFGDRGKALAAISYILGALRVLYAQRHRYNILHCHLMISPMTIGLIARLLLQKPLVINPHRSGPIGDIGTLTARRPLLGKLRVAAGRRWGDAFVSISRAIHTELRDVRVSEDKIWDICNGVDVEHFRPVDAATKMLLRQQLGLPQGPLLAYTGRLATEKGLHVLLDAWAVVQRRIPDAYLLLIGAGEEQAALEAQAQHLGISERVIFAGTHADVAPYLQTSDGFTLPSFAEGLPIALLEALACGLPSVATAISGTMQVLQDNVGGRLVPPGDAQALAVGIEEVLLGPQMHEWADQARQHIVNHYSLDAVAERYIQMYEALLDRLAGLSLLTKSAPQHSSIRFDS